LSDQKKNQLKPKRFTEILQKIDKSSNCKIHNPVKCSEQCLDVIWGLHVSYYIPWQYIPVSFNV